MPARNAASASTASASTAGGFQFGEAGFQFIDPASETFDLSIARVRCSSSGLGPRRAAAVTRRTEMTAARPTLQPMTAQPPIARAPQFQAPSPRARIPAWQHSDAAGALGIPASIASDTLSDRRPEPAVPPATNRSSPGGTAPGPAAPSARLGWRCRSCLIRPPSRRNHTGCTGGAKPRNRLPRCNRASAGAVCAAW